MSISAFVWHPFHFFLTLLIKKKLQDPSEVIKCICPFLECLITLVRCTDSPPSECQKEEKDSVLASFSNFAPIGKLCVVRGVLDGGPIVLMVVPFGLKACVPQLPTVSKLVNKVNNIWHVVEITVSLKPNVDNLWPVLATKGKLLSL